MNQLLGLYFLVKGLSVSPQTSIVLSEWVIKWLSLSEIADELAAELPFSKGTMFH